MGAGRAAWVARRADVALVHLTHFFLLPLRRDRPYLVTIHDLVPLLFPVYNNSRAMQWYLRFVCATAPRADLILTDSDHSARDITEHLGVPGERIRAIDLAADERYRPLPERYTSDDRRSAREVRITGPFIFNVGGLDVRKNLAALLRAFALVRSQLPKGSAYEAGPRTRIMPSATPTSSRWRASWASPTPPSSPGGSAMRRSWRC